MLHKWPKLRAILFLKTAWLSQRLDQLKKLNWKKYPAGKPTVVHTNTNVHTAGMPKIFLAGKPRICTPGQDTFILPKTVQAIDTHHVAYVPEIVIAKDAYAKDQNPQNFSSFGKLQGLKNGNISSLLEDKYGNLWFGYWGGGVTKYDGKNFTHFTDKDLYNVFSILEDKSGNLWFAGGGVTRYDGKNFTHFAGKEGLSDNILSQNGVSSILEDKSGNIWIGTHGDGVTKYDSKAFTHFTEKQGLVNKFVNSMSEDQSGNLWFGTNGGVSKYDGKSFTNFTVKDGLSNNGIVSILEDKSGNLWFGTAGGGVIKYDGKSFTNYTVEEGLSYALFTYDSEGNVINDEVKDTDGTLYFEDIQSFDKPVREPMVAVPGLPYPIPYINYMISKLKYTYLKEFGLDDKGNPVTFYELDPDKSTLRAGPERYAVYYKTFDKVSGLSNRQVWDYQNCDCEDEGGDPQFTLPAFKGPASIGKRQRQQYISMVQMREQIKQIRKRNGK